MMESQTALSSTNLGCIKLAFLSQGLSVVLDLTNFRGPGDSILP